MPHLTATRADWLAARTALLAEEKELTRRRDELAARRRELPWVRIETDYRFTGPEGEVGLADLFAGRGQLLVYHFMLGPGWGEGCASCSYVSDHFDACLPHLAARDVALVAVSRAPYAEIAAFRQRMGWTFPWFSSFGSGFNHDFGVSFTAAELQSGAVAYNYARGPFPAEEAPGLSAFARDASGQVSHTYSTYARGLDGLIGTYALLDLAPRGRDEAALGFTMAWVRHHDRYATAPAAACGRCVPGG